VHSNLGEYGRCATAARPISEVYAKFEMSLRYRKATQFDAATALAKSERSVAGSFGNHRNPVLPTAASAQSETSSYDQESFHRHRASGGSIHPFGTASIIRPAVPAVTKRKVDPNVGRYGRSASQPPVERPAIRSSQWPRRR